MSSTWTVDKYGHNRSYRIGIATRLKVVEERRPKGFGTVIHLENGCVPIITVSSVGRAPKINFGGPGFDPRQQYAGFPETKTKMNTVYAATSTLQTKNNYNSWHVVCCTWTVDKYNEHILELCPLLGL